MRKTGNTDRETSIQFKTLPPLTVEFYSFYREALYHTTNTSMKGITVEELKNDTDYGLGLEVISGTKGLSRRIYNSKIQKLGLVITGRMVYLHPHRVQILGNTEITYLRSLSEEDSKNIIQELCKNDVVCFIITRNLKVPDFFISETKKRDIPLLRTALMTSLFIEKITNLLEDKLAPSTVIHGVLVDVLGVGILIIGRPGIGKSENALELIMRGHRLVVDDVVFVKKMGALDLYGNAPEMIKNLLEVRGVGIVDVSRLFGVSAVVEEKKIELVIELVDWDDRVECERVGLKEETYSLLRVNLPFLRIPISSGRNVSAIIELACRNFILKREGFNTAQQLEDKLIKTMGEKQGS